MVLFSKVNHYGANELVLSCNSKPYIQPIIKQDIKLLYIK